MADFENWTCGALRNEVMRLLGTKAKELGREELVRLLNVLLWDFGLYEVEPVVATADDRRRLSEDLRHISPRFLAPEPSAIVDGWSTEPTDIPVLNYGDIFGYLIARPSLLFNSGTLSAYKSLESYLIVRCGDVRGFKVFKDLPSGWRFATADVHASQRKDSYKPWVIVHGENGTIRGGLCTCPAGLGQTCSHVAALLFYMQRATEEGINRQQTPTEVMCSWLQPTALNDDATTQITAAFECVKRTRYISPDDRGPLLWNYDPHLLKFLHQCGSVTRFGQLPQRVPTSAAIIPVSPPSTPPVTPDPTVAPEPTDFEDVEACVWFPTSSETIQDFLTSGGSKTDYKGMLDAIKDSVNEDDSRRIEEKTRRQSKSVQWRRCRLERATASMAHSIYTHYNKNGGRKFGRIPETAIKLVLGQENENVRFKKDVQWGIDNEQNAFEMVKRHLSARHRNIIVEKVGLKVPPGMGHMGASADGLIWCECGCSFPSTILEVKCPPSICHKDPKKLKEADKKLVPYLHIEGDQISLNRQHTYYTQVQMEMGCWGFRHALFVVWTLVGCLEVAVEFDEDYWMDLLQRIDRFFEDYIVPRLALNVMGDL